MEMEGIFKASAHMQPSQQEVLEERNNFFLLFLRLVKAFSFGVLPRRRASGLGRLRRLVRITLTQEPTIRTNHRFILFASV